MLWRVLLLHGDVESNVNVYGLMNCTALVPWYSEGWRHRHYVLHGNYLQPPPHRSIVIAAWFVYARTEFTCTHKNIDTVLRGFFI